MTEKTTKFGYFNTNPKFMKKWTAAEYLINNQQILKSKSCIFPLVPLAAKKNIVIKYVLYAIFDLHDSQLNYARKGMDFNQIYKKIQENKNHYDLLIRKRIDRVIEVSTTNSYNRSKILKNTGANLQNMIMKKKIEQKERFQKNNKVKKDDVYFALAILLGTFLDLKYKVNTSTTQTNEIVNKKPNEKTYKLSKEGIRLKVLVKKDSYVL